MRTTIEGPKLRWISRKEEVKVEIPPPPPPSFPVTPSLPLAPATAAYRSVYGPPGTLFTPTTYSYTSGAVTKTTVASSSSILAQAQSPIAIPSTTQSTTPSAAPSQLTFSQYTPYQPAVFPAWPPQAQQSSYYPSTTSATSVQSPTFIMQTPNGQQAEAVPSTQPVPTQQLVPLGVAPTPVPPEPEYRTETVTKNYVIHELAQERGAPKPSWTENMQAMFGDHVKWDEVKVLVGKGRPLCKHERYSWSWNKAHLIIARPRQTCPITGRQAHYLDPRTGVPYADSHAYQVLTQLLRHEYVWNPSIGSYMDKGEAPEPPLVRED